MCRHGVIHPSPCGNWLISTWFLVLTGGKVVSIMVFMLHLQLDVFIRYFDHFKKSVGMELFAHNHVETGSFQRGFWF
jgi:hypothetical protein